MDTWAAASIAAVAAMFAAESAAATAVETVATTTAVETVAATTTVVTVAATTAMETTAVATMAVATMVAVDTVAEVESIREKEARLEQSSAPFAFGFPLPEIRRFSSSRGGPALHKQPRHSVFATVDGSL